ncbi:BRCA1-associated RING domain protein 1 [Mortierella sp. GBA35]|nr:BRCA1-associated RING domain protein 1 [Mortierella sp. GBA35]
MAPFDDALERMEGLLRCPLCSDELQLTFTVKECGHHFCQKCIYPVLGTLCVCPTCSIPARVGNLVKNPSYDILVACVTKLRALRLAQDTNKAQYSQRRSSQDNEQDTEAGTPIGSPIWTYDCGPTFPNSDRFSSLSNVEAQTFPSVDAAMTIHRREIEIQSRAEAGQESKQTEAERDQECSEDDTATEVFNSQQSAVHDNENHHPTPPPLPPTISQLQRLLSIRKGNSPTPLHQESETPTQRISYPGDFSESTNGVTSRFNTPRMPTQSFWRNQLDLGSQQISDTEQMQDRTDQQASNGASRKRRMQTEEYTGPSEATSSSGASSRNKKPLRAVPRRDHYSPDDMIGMRGPHPDQQSCHTMNHTGSRIQREIVESGGSSDAKRVWACICCYKVMNVGRDVHIDRCPACGRNQGQSETNGDAGANSSTTTKDDDGEYGQVIESSQPTLDPGMFTLLPRLDLPVRAAGRSSSHPLQTLPSTSSRDTGSSKDQGLFTSDPNSTTHSSTDSDRTASTRSRSTSEPTTAISCVFTGLSKEQKNAFDDNITRVIEAGLFMEHMPDQVFNEAATHVITSVDSCAWKRFGVALCPRVLKYLVGMLSSAWIVRHEWFIDSIECRKWLPLPDERYLIQGDAQFGPAPGTQHRRELRMQQSLKLFGSCRMFFYGEFGTAAQKSIKKQELLRLVQCGGASVLMKRPPKSSSSRSRSRTPGGGEPTGPNNNDDDDFFSPTRSFLYLTEDTKPWLVNIDKSIPIIVCDPAKIPSGYVANSTTTSSSSQRSATTTITEMTLSQADLKKHGWLRDFQAVSLTWVLNCISCSLMGKGDVDLLYGSLDPIEIRQLDQAWDLWRAKKT